MVDEQGELNSYRLNMPHLLIRLNDLRQQKQVLARHCGNQAKTIADGKSKFKALIAQGKKGKANQDLSISDIVDQSLDSGADVD